MELTKFEVKNFYDYKIRSIVKDDVEMFFVTDLISQYTDTVYRRDTISVY